MVAKVFLGSKEVLLDELIEIRNPYSKEVVSKYPKCSIELTKEAIEISKKAFLNSNSKLSDRIKWLEDVVKELEANQDDFAKTICDEVGKPIKFARVEVSRAIETLKLTIIASANYGKTIPTDIMPSGKKTLSFYKREPIGLIGCITPFNFPLNLVMHKIAPALIAGNSVILKPTPEAPLTAYKLVSLFVKSPYAQKDMISLVYGDSEVGSEIVTNKDVNMISFTGSVAVGNIITKSAGIKKISLELGGNAATYIDKSADLNLAANKCAIGAFINSGQVCISLQRIYVNKEIYDEFAKKLKEETKKLKVGNPYDEDTFLGPLINQDSLDRVKSWIESAKSEGATIYYGGESEGLNFSPTIVTDVKDDMNIVCQEVFAPIVSLVSVDSFDEAIDKMNDSPYGLQFSIFTNDLSQTNLFIEKAQAGGVVVNDMPTLRFDVQPYGGIKLSGIGREGPEFAIEEFTQIKSIVIC